MELEHQVAHKGLIQGITARQWSDKDNIDIYDMKHQLHMTLY